MPLLALNSGLRQYKKIEQAIDDFNATADDDAMQKIYRLQGLNALIERAPPSQELDAWINNTTNVGWEQQLQKIGVHRDASAYLKSVEFAQAVQRASNKKETPYEGETLYTLLIERDALLQSPNDLKTYERVNRRLFALSNQDEKLQARTLEHRHFLALSYAKLEAIKGVVEQNFDEYNTQKLGGKNNVNFFLDIDGEPNPLVIRVEDRSTLSDEADLQRHPVSEYFSEDYATMMLPFKGNEEFDEVGYQPVVLSQYASGGDLSHFSERLASESSEVKGKTAQTCFSQLSDFLLKLEDSGHYHPDIKLSNFLYDDGRVFCADRKTLLSTEQAPIGKISTTPCYAPPEYLEKIHIEKDGIVVKKSGTRIDMPSFMQYQVGSAISEYLDNTRALNDNPLSNQVQNLGFLQTELMRDNPNDRLKLQDFNQLITQIDKNPSAFLTQLEALHPKDNLSFNQNIKELEQILASNNLSLEQVYEITKVLPEGTLSDARYQTVQSKIEEQIKKLEKQLHNQDKALATRTERTLDFLGIQRVPERAQSEQTKIFISALKDLIEPKQVELVKQVKQVAKNESVVSEDLSDISTVIAEPYSSGTFVQKPVEEVVEPYSSGTFMQKPVEDVKEPYSSGTFVQKLEIDCFEFDDLVVRDSPASSNAGTEVNQYSPKSSDSSGTMAMIPDSPKPENMANILKSMFEEETRPEQEADDVDTTIERGNAKQSFKDALNKIKEEKSSDEHEQEKKQNPGSTPNL
ncbi:MAG: hypothetical protein P1U39_07205 [Legionellaceae bacterium]|nr:hypothetical protein [Legionellaceae bacterium]